MTEKVKITSFEIENVKRVQAVAIEPLETGLTIIGGDNNQGKSSNLDAIMSALGGEKFTPSDPIHDGAAKSKVSVKLSNGFLVTRVFTKKGTRLKIDVPSGGKATQTVINEFISAFALDLKKFLDASDKTKAETLLKIIGVDLTPFNERISELEADRLVVGRQQVKAKGHAESLPYDEKAGNELLTPTDIMAELEKKISINAKNIEIRNDAEILLANLKRQEEKRENVWERIQDLEKQLATAKKEEEEQRSALKRMDEEHGIAKAHVDLLIDEDTTAIKDKLAEIDAMNARVRVNLERDKAFSDTETYHQEYLSLQHQIESERGEKLALLNGAKMPLEELSIENDALIYKGRAWDCMSHSEQLIVATAICRTINPKMGFVLIDKLEALDIPTLNAFGAWLVKEGLQAITTRVSQGSECSVIIEDGLIRQNPVKK